MKRSTLQQRMRDYLLVTTLQSHNNDFDAAVAHWQRVLGDTAEFTGTPKQHLIILLHHYVSNMHPDGLASAAKSARLTVKSVSDHYFNEARFALGTIY